MFEDLKQNKVADMFADTDPAASPAASPAAPMPQPMTTTDKPSAVQSGKMRPVSSTSPLPMAPLTTKDMMMTEGKGGRVKNIAIVIALVLVLGVGSWWAYNFWQNRPKESVNTNQNTNINTNANTNINTNINTNANFPTNQQLDDDSDGLSNAEENNLGSDPLDPDTDNDGLFDREEVRVFKTNPRSSDSDNDGLMDREEIATWSTDPNDPDSDGDGYNDGTEVQNGYNPLGMGLASTSTNETF